MEKRVRIPDNTIISFDHLEIYILEYQYRAKTPEKDEIVCFYPKKQSASLAYNSFAPIIRIQQTTDSSGTWLHIIGEKRRVTRYFLFTFYGLAGLLQCLLIDAILNGYMAFNLIPALLPGIMIVFLLTISNIVEYLFIRIFTKTIVCECGI